MEATFASKDAIHVGSSNLRWSGSNIGGLCRKIREKPRCANMVLICAHQVIRFRDAFQPQNLRMGVIDPLAWISNYWTF